MEALNSAETMYDKLLAEIMIRDDYYQLLESAEWKTAENKEILQPENSQEGEKYIALIQRLDDEQPDIQFMTCSRADEEGKNLTEAQQEKVIEKKVALPVTGENIILYAGLGAIIVAIVIMLVLMKKAKKDENKE